ncbi:MAG: alanyl-tRNA editing protein, partial [Alphaproteobacteria bacterium]|nr:alanyl-tRNA editing protein [Alphaproteobacteria bacterium]
MTRELFREDSYLKSCRARVVAAGPEGVVLDQTVFYPMGGGQPGDTGTLIFDDGQRLAVTDTRKG